MIGGDTSRSLRLVLGDFLELEGVVARIYAPTFVTDKNSMLAHVRYFTKKYERQVTSTNKRQLL